MQCFYGYFDLPDENDSGKSAIVSFHIPDIGIRFKAPFLGVDPDHSDLASLLALLEFIDSNQKYFTNKTYDIFGNNLATINRVNGKEAFPSQFEPLMQKAAKYREKYRFSLSWISSSDNSAIDSILD